VCDVNASVCVFRVIFTGCVVCMMSANQCSACSDMSMAVINTCVSDVSVLRSAVQTSCVTGV
jgi:hypothetical protein